MPSQHTYSCTKSSLVCVPGAYNQRNVHQLLDALSSLLWWCKSVWTTVGRRTLFNVNYVDLYEFELGKTSFITCKLMPLGSRKFSFSKKWQFSFFYYTVPCLSHTHTLIYFFLRICVNVILTSVNFRYAYVIITIQERNAWHSDDDPLNFHKNNSHLSKSSFWILIIFSRSSHIHSWSTRTRRHVADNIVEMMWECQCWFCSFS